MFDPQDQTLSYYIYGIRETVTVRSSVTRASKTGIISSVGMNGIIYLQEWGDAQGLYIQRGRNLRLRDIPNRYMLMASRLDEKDEMD